MVTMIGEIAECVRRASAPALATTREHISAGCFIQRVREMVLRAVMPPSKHSVSEERCW